MKGLTPKDVDKDEWAQGKIYLDKFLHNTKMKDDFKFEVGDKVRILLAKGLHDKEGRTFSTAIYTVDSIIQNKYKVMDDEGKVPRRGFKPHELLKVNTDKLKSVAIPDNVSRVLKTQQNVRVLRREGITNEEESRRLVDEVEKMKESQRRHDSMEKLNELPRRHNSMEELDELTRRRHSIDELNEPPRRPHIPDAPRKSGRVRKAPNR